MVWAIVHFLCSLLMCPLCNCSLQFFSYAYVIALTRKTKQNTRSKNKIVIVFHLLQDTVLLFDTSLKYVRLNISCGDEEGASNYIIC